MPASVKPGERLDRFLVTERPDFSRSQLQKLIADARITVNEASVKARHGLREGDIIHLLPVPAEAESLEAEAIPLDILFEDEHLIALNKAEGMVVHPGAGNDRGTLVHALLHHCEGKLSDCGEPDRPGIVHRLDKDTSGCMIVAKTNQAHQGLAIAFSGRMVRKEYLCVVQGTLDGDHGEIRNFIGRNPGNRQKMGILPEDQGRHAATDWRVLRRGEGWSLVHCRIHTGRTHQIRVHMAQTLRHPIIGDPIYGRGTLKHPLATRFLLHSWKLGIEHPVSAEDLAFEAPVPDAFPTFRSD